jgi:pyruvate dehydrogenase E2 component (dihydrolipoamide acetyltransferase)
MSPAEPLSRMRKAIARSMSASAAIPQFEVEMDARIGLLKAMREEIRQDRRPSYQDVLVASVAQALHDQPGVNVSFTEDGLVRHEDVNVAFAIALEDGLISPAILAADTLTLDELQAERRRLTAAAKGGVLRPDELLSATFTISNLGPLGVRRFRALVVPPQAAILAVGAVDGDSITLVLSADHRALDGAPAALFLGQVKSQLEDQSWLKRSFAGQAAAA